MKYCFGDIVVVEETQIGVVIKTWVRNNEEIIYEVYVRNLNSIKEYKEKDIQRYMVRHKELNEEEIEYQNNAINPFVSKEEIEQYNIQRNIEFEKELFGYCKNSKKEKSKGYIYLLE